MLALSQFILRFSYYYARLLGVINFEIDARTGRARVTSRATIYAAVANVLTFSLLPLLSVSELMHTMWTSAGLLHEYLFLSITGMHITCVVITVLNRWWQRALIVRVVNDLSRLNRQNPEIMLMNRYKIIVKFVTVVLSEFLHIVINLLTQPVESSPSVLLDNFLLCTLTALVNVIISHFYFAMLFVNNHYILLNQELRAVLTDIRELEGESRKAAVMSKCCSLADRLEAIAKSQSELSKLVERLACIFGIQCLCVASNIYMTSIATIYFTFAIVKEKPGFGWISLLMFADVIFYLIDLFISFKNTFSVLDSHQSMLLLLQQNGTFAPGLDERLQTVLECFQLQLLRNPFRFRVLDTFNIKKSNSIIVGSSIVSNSLVLIQYELKNT